MEKELIEGLHVFKGNDYSLELRIKHLLAYTSGLADYFEGNRMLGKSFSKTLMSGTDLKWSAKDALLIAKGMGPHFAPGAKGKAFYSDTNFQLLGMVLESVLKESYAVLCKKYIIDPLGLKSTYVYQDPFDRRPKDMYYKNNTLSIPNAMSCFGPDGGVVSTAEEFLRFTESFFKGKLFPLSYIDDLQQWNRIFSPLQSGVGIHLFELPSFIGHSGLSGAVAYFCPSENIFIAGTVNQVDRPDLSFRIMIKMVLLLKKFKADA